MTPPEPSAKPSIYLYGSAQKDAAHRRSLRFQKRRAAQYQGRMLNLANTTQMTIAHAHPAPPLIHDMLKRERMDLRTLVSQATETLKPPIGERRHRLTLAMPDEPVWLWADAGRLEQVFVNLLANASRYTDTGGELNVWVHRRDRQVVVRVRDNGRGIARDSLPHIFDLFTRGHDTGRHCPSGLGIGLAVVRHLVELHGGRVTAASAGAGQGSEFTVRLPTEN